MTITVEAHTGASTIGDTEWSLVTNSAGPNAEAASGVFQAFVDLSAMDTYDVYLLQVYEKARTGDAQHVVCSAYFEGAQDEPIAATPSLILGIGWDITIKKISGTDRSINWRISKAS
jgi:hypothetical protein